jgi:hypothetical protein
MPGRPGTGGGALARDVGVGNKESTSTVTARACVIGSGGKVWTFGQLLLVVECPVCRLGVYRQLRRPRNRRSCNGYATGVESIHPQPDEGSHDP